MQSEFGYEASVVMTEQGVHFDASFVPCERITADFSYTLTATSPSDPAISHWKVR